MKYHIIKIAKCPVQCHYTSPIGESLGSYIDVNLAYRQAQSMNDEYSRRCRSDGCKCAVVERD